MDNQSEESINGEKGGFIRMERASGREIKETVRKMTPITRAIMMMQSVFWRQTRGNEGSKMYKRIFLYRLIHDNTSKWILINDFNPLSLFSSFFFFVSTVFALFWASGLVRTLIHLFCQREE